MRRMRLLRLLALPLLLAAAAPEPPVTVFLAGDSTAAPKRVDRRPETGWGEALQQHFDPDRVRVENHARNGRSTRTFLEEGRWQAVLDRLRPGDYVLIQFGHNDASPEKRDRYTPPADFRANLVRFVREARARQANPVLLTPVRRRRFDASGALVDTHGEYPDIVRAVAAQERTPLIDVHRASADVLTRYGPAGSRKLFLHLAPGEHANYPGGLRDDTHFSPLGAEAVAALVAQGIREAGIALDASPARPPAAPREAGYLAPERIAALPAAERRAWERYLAESRRRRSVDERALAAELRAAGVERLAPAPAAPGFEVGPEMTPEWFRGEVARRIADAVVSFQTPAGGWSKRMAFERPRRPGEGWTSEGNERWLGTFDNDATTEQLRFLAGAFAAHGDPRHRAAFLRGLDYVLRAQFPGGCWPQVYPLAGSYHDAATFNDGATVNVLRLLREVGRGDLAWVPEGARRRAREGVGRGVGCILASQVVVDGRRTLWGQQHDPLTLAPVGARSYEHAALSGSEGAEVLGFLMGLDAPDARVRAAVRGAAAWLRENALWGLEYHGAARVTPRPGAGPLWARFHEIGTNRPLFSNRDGVVRYDPRELTDRAEGYAWYTTEPAARLRRYRAWSRRHAEPPLRPGRGTVSAVVDAAYAGPEGARVGGVRRYRSIGRAVADAPDEAAAPYVVSVRDGRYREKLSVEKPGVHLVGESRDGTVLTHDAAAGTRSPGGWTYGTRGSWTLRVAAPDFRLERMTVENAFDHPGNAARAEGDPARIEGTQAVAVMLDEGSDRAVFRECAVTGHQDTLFPDSGRSWFERCTVAGSVDFVFGAGVAVFEESEIVSRERGSRGGGYVAAPSTPAEQPYGFVFLRSRLRRESPGVAPGSVALARPWHPAGNPHASPSAAFVECWMDDHVAPERWAAMGSRDAAGHRETWRPEEARFREHGGAGPGAAPGPARGPAGLAVERVLGGWDPRR